MATFFLCVCGYLFMGWLTLIGYVYSFRLAKDIQTLEDIDSDDLTGGVMVIVFWPIALTLLCGLLSIQAAMKLGKQLKDKRKGKV